MLLLSVLLVAADPRSVAFSLTKGPVSHVPDITQSAETNTICGTIKNGDTASSLLRPFLSLQTIYALEKESRPIFSFTRFRKGQPYRLFFKDDKLTGLEYDIDENDRLVISEDAGMYKVNRVPIKYEIRQSAIAVEIATTLSDAVEAAGEKTELACQLSDIFAWDIDFVKDIQPGDRFQVLVERRYRHGECQGYGNILAAVFVNKGQEYKAFHYTDSRGCTGYYDEAGQPLQKAFLKSPVNYSRISSYFSARRFHPILKRYRPHPGVDYAAPKNTPIKSVAEGNIKQIGYNKTMGRYITIRHFNGYETSYFHMNKYAGGMKRRKEVKQGEVIGYVGKTGLATGYHLCFRMTKNGRPINPLKHATPSSAPVSAKEMEGFIARVRQYNEQLLAAESLAQSRP